MTISKQLAEEIAYEIHVNLWSRWNNDHDIQVDLIMNELKEFFEYRLNESDRKIVYAVLLGACMSFTALQENERARRNK